MEESDSHSGSRIVSNILYELESDQIDKILDVLKSKYQHQFGGLEATGYGQYVKGISVPRFSPAGQKRFVQIFNTSDHWVCATNIFSKHSHDVYVYDSLYETLSETLIVQVTSILRADAEKDAITFHIRSFQQQKRTTRLCGFYALAAAVSILHNKDPTFELFDEESMNPTYRKLCMGVVETFSSITVDVDSPDVNMVVVNKLHCKCQKQANDKMMQCNKCKNWYHMGTCVPVSTDRRTTNKMTWFGPCCSGDSADVVEIIDLNWTRIICTEKDCFENKQYFVIWNKTT